MAAMDHYIDDKYSGKLGLVER